VIASLETIAQRAYSSLHTVRASYDIADMALRRGVRGDFVECGVAAGSNAAAMALAIKGPWQGCPRVHLFDSFEGIPQAGEHDAEFLAAGHKAGLTAVSLEDVKRNMKEWGIPNELLVYHPGWFADSMRLNDRLGNVEKIAVLRLDGDLYESTKVCLEQLLPLVSPGGWVIIDDFDLSGARKAALEVVGHNFGPVYFQRHS
jgi:O-methyltransferase